MTLTEEILFHTSPARPKPGVTRDPPKFFESVAPKTRPGYRTESWYNEPWKPVPAPAQHVDEATAPPQHDASESSERRCFRVSASGNVNDDVAQDYYRRLVRSNQGVAKQRAYDDVPKEPGHKIPRREHAKFYASRIRDLALNTAAEQSCNRRINAIRRRAAKGFGESYIDESIPIEEVSAKAKLMYLRRKLKRRYFKRKPTAVAFQDVVMPADDSLT